MVLALQCSRATRTSPHSSVVVHIVVALLRRRGQRQQEGATQRRLQQQLAAPPTFLRLSLFQPPSRCLLAVRHNRTQAATYLRSIAIFRFARSLNSVRYPLLPTVLDLFFPDRPNCQSVP